MKNIKVHFICFAFLARCQAQKAVIENATLVEPPTPENIQIEVQNKNDGDRYAFCPVGRRKAKRYFIQEQSEKFNEISYMAYSHQTHNGSPVVWAGSDGKQTEVSAINLETGEVIGTWTLIGVKGKGDWEAMSLGPCGYRSISDGGKTCIYLGVIGNNGAQWCVDHDCNWGRDQIKVYKVKEPNVNRRRRRVRVSTMVLDYHNEELPTSRADAETLFIDWTGDDAGGNPGDLYIVTKFYDPYCHQSRLTKLPIHVHRDLEVGGQLYATLELAGTPYADNPLWTGGDMTTDGSIVALRDYDHVFFFPRPRTMTVGEALEGAHCDFTSATNYEIRDEEYWFETVAMSGRSSMAETHECSRPKKGCKVAISVYELQYENAAVARNAHLFPGSRRLTSDEFTLVGTRWELTHIRNDTSLSPVLSEPSVSVEFRTDGRVDGDDGCNWYSGMYSLEDDGSSISFPSPFWSTKAACFPHSIMTQSYHYLEALSDSVTYNVSKDILEFRDSPGTVTLRFVAVKA